MSRILICAGLVAAAMAMPAFAAEEFPIAKPMLHDDMTIAPNYLTGVQMDRHPLGMGMMKDSVHLEADVHAAKGEMHGFAQGAWIPYLSISFVLTKDGKPTYKKAGLLYPMTAKDGPHYANNVDMAGPGTYHLTYLISPPSSNGFIRHIDKDSGVPPWWKPFSESWSFTYPGKDR